jgi:hypothetical protein
MSVHTEPSTFRFEKQRADALLRLSSGDARRGCFFVAGASSRGDGPERIGDLLNAEPGFIPFEVLDPGGTRILLVNRQHIVTVGLAEDEASLDPGYVIAPQHAVEMRLTTGERIRGIVRVCRPEGYDRLSDWTREPETFRYVETAAGTLLVNSAHVLEISEVQES